MFVFNKCGAIYGHKSIIDVLVKNVTWRHLSFLSDTQVAYLYFNIYLSNKSM